MAVRAGVLWRVSKCQQMKEAEKFKTGVCPIPVPMKEYRWLRLDFTATDGKREFEEMDTQRLQIAS